MITITRRIEFDAAHRVLHHESKCKHIHGHRYVAELTVTAPHLDSLGRVIDFGILKTVIGRWIDDNWDHNVILNSEDPLAILFKNMGDNKIGLADAKTDRVMGYVDPIFQGKVPFILSKMNPTAEILASYLLAVSSQLLHATPLEITHVRMYETPNCWADAYKEPAITYTTNFVTN